MSDLSIDLPVSELPLFPVCASDGSTQESEAEVAEDLAVDNWMNAWMAKYERPAFIGVSQLWVGMALPPPKMTGASVGIGVGGLVALLQSWQRATTTMIVTVPTQAAFLQKPVGEVENIERQLREGQAEALAACVRGLERLIDGLLEAADRFEHYGLRPLQMAAMDAAASLGTIAASVAAERGDFHAALDFAEKASARAVSPNMGKAWLGSPVGQTLVQRTGAMAMDEGYRLLVGHKLAEAEKAFACAVRVYALFTDSDSMELARTVSRPRAHAEFMQAALKEQQKGAKALAEGDLPLARAHLYNALGTYEVLLERWPNKLERRIRSLLSEAIAVLYRELAQDKTAMQKSDLMQAGKYFAETARRRPYPNAERYFDEARLAYDQARRLGVREAAGALVGLYIDWAYGIPLDPNAEAPIVSIEENALSVLIRLEIATADQELLSPLDRALAESRRSCAYLRLGEDSKGREALSRAIELLPRGPSSQMDEARYLVLRRDLSAWNLQLTARVVEPFLDRIAVRAQILARVALSRAALSATEQALARLARIIGTATSASDPSQIADLRQDGRHLYRFAIIAAQLGGDDRTAARYWEKARQNMRASGLSGPESRYWERILGQYKPLVILLDPQLCATALDWQTLPVGELLGAEALRSMTDQHPAGHLTVEGILIYLYGEQGMIDSVTEREISALIRAAQARGELTPPRVARFYLEVAGELKKGSSVDADTMGRLWEQGLRPRQEATAGRGLAEEERRRDEDKSKASRRNGPGH